MSEHLFYLSAIGSALWGLSMVLRRLLNGVAEVKRANFEGKALLIRAERGDAEPPVILQLDRTPRA